MHGLGKYFYVNGETYNGGWVSGQRSGSGEMTYLNGDVYVGEWSMGKREGKGTLTKKGSGDTFEGLCPVLLPFNLQAHG
jgi:hypothetical protein